MQWYRSWLTQPVPLLQAENKRLRRLIGAAPQAEADRLNDVIESLIVR